MHPTIFALKRAYQSSRHALELELQGSELTVAQLDVIKLLLEPTSGMGQRALQAALGITSATLTRLLAGMERRAFVTRAPHPTDARGKTVRLTPRARKLFEAQMGGGERDFTARLLHGFSHAETQTLTKLLGRIAANMTQAVDPDHRYR
jgi:DNA-binding MarR family transcriptional regulator